MARQNYFQNSFSSGELSPLLYAQKNLDRYRNGLSLCRNLVTLPYGGLTKRPGTLFQGQSQKLDPNIRLLSFQFSSTQSYVLEMGEHYLRFYNQQGLILSGLSPYTVAHPYLSSELGAVQYIQSNDVLIFTHPNHPPQRLSRFAELNWVLEAVPFSFGPFNEGNNTPTLLTPSGTTGSVTLTASSAVFAATDEGRQVQLTQATTTSTLTITQYASSTSVTATVNQALANTNPTTLWALGSFSASSGYPATCSFYEDRLFFAGTQAEPQTLWGSVEGDYYNFKSGPNDSDALYLPLLSRNYNAIQWLYPHKVLLAGTSSSLWPISSSNFRDIPLTPTTARTAEEIAYGWDPQVPVMMNKSLLAVQLGGKKVREVFYSFDQDGFESSEVTLLAEHITGNGISQGCSMTTPYEIYWARRADGKLLGLTYLKDQQTAAWHVHDLGGRLDSLTTIQNGQEEQLWVLITRTLHGEPVQTIERLSPFFLRQDFYQSCFLDCARQWSGLQNATLEIDPIPQTPNFTVTANAPIFGQTTAQDALFILGPDTDGFLRAPTAPLQVISVLSPTQLLVTGDAPLERVVAPNTWALASTVLSGLNHLEGQRVQVLGDGADLGFFTVLDGQVVLDQPCFNLTAGLPYEALLETLDWEAASALGSSEGQLSRIHEVALRLYEASVGFYQARESDKWSSDYHLRATTTPYDTAEPLFTGIQTVKPAGGFGRQLRLRLGSRGPLPWTLLGLMAKVSVSDT